MPARWPRRTRRILGSMPPPDPAGNAARRLRPRGIAILALAWLIALAGGGELAARFLFDVPSLDPPFIASPERAGDASELAHQRSPASAAGRIFVHGGVHDPVGVGAWFALPKPAGTLHLGCVGGSVMAGKEPQRTLCAALARRLAAARPGTEVRFINEGKVASPSWAVARRAAALLELADLDLLVVHTAHNEFLLDRHRLVEPAVPPWLSRPAAWARASRLVAAFSHRATAEVVRERLASASLDGASWRLLRFGPHAVLRRHPDAEAWTERVVARYGESIDAIARAAQEHDVPVVFIDGARNPADREYLEAVPESDVSPARARGLAERAAHLGGWIDAENWSEVGEEARQLLGEEPRYATAWQALGMARRHAGDIEGAKGDFQRAADHAGFPSAATSAISAELHRAAAARGAAVGSAAAWLDDGRGLPDPALFLDDVHPTDEGHERLARGLFGLIDERGLLPGGP